MGLQGTSREAITDEQGVYSFSDLPAGPVTLAVSYTGLETSVVSAVVTAGQANRHDVGLTAEIYKMGQFVAASEREGNAQALTLHRLSSGLKNIVSTDAFGNLADNPAELLVRLPGVEGETQDGDVRVVRIRGVNQNLTTITMDGNRLPDASNVGGKFAVALNVGYRGIYNPQDVVTQAHEAVPSGSAAPGYTYSVNFNDSREEQCRQGGGLRLDYKLSDTTRFFFITNLTKNIEHQGDRYAIFSTNQSVATRDAAGNLTGTGGIVPGYTEALTTVRPVAASTLTMRSYTAYKQGKTTTYQVGGVHRYKLLDIDYDGYKSDSKSNFTGQRDFILTVPNIGFTIDKSVDPYFPVVTQTAGPDITKIESYTGNRYSIGRLAGWDKFLGASLNVKKKFETRFPTFVKTGLRLREQSRQNENTSWSGAYVGPDGVQGVNPATRLNDDDLGQFGFVEPGEFNTKRTRYPNIPHPAFSGRTNTRLDDAQKNSPQLFRQEIAANIQTNLTGDQTFKENVDAAYVMGNVDIKKLTILAGVRVERTKVMGEGALQAISPAEAARRAAWVGAVTDAELRRRNIEEYSGRQTRTGKYTDVLPGVHLKYSPIPKLITRLSYAENIGRPNAGQLIPRTNVNYDNMTVSSSNPNLKPQIAQNYNLMAEYYFEPAGMVSAGVFRKEIKQFIYTAGGATIPTGADNGFGGEYAGYSYTTQYNGGSARIEGFELNYSQQFTFLPGFWAGFGVFANYTRMRTEGNYGAGNAISLTPNPVGKVAGFNPIFEALRCLPRRQQRAQRS